MLEEGQFLHIVREWVQESSRVKHHSLVFQAPRKRYLETQRIFCLRDKT